MSLGRFVHPDDFDRPAEQREAGADSRAEPFRGFSEAQTRFRVVSDLPVELRGLRGRVEPVFLRWAAARATAVGLGADTIVMRSGVIDEDTMLTAVCEELGVEADLLEDNTRLWLDVPDVLSSGLLPPRPHEGHSHLTLALTGNNLRILQQHLAQTPELAQQVRITSFERLRNFVLRSSDERLAFDAAFGLQRDRPRFSAGLVRYPWYALGIFIALATIVALWIAPPVLAIRVVLLGLELLFAAVFIAWAGLRLAACFVRPRPRRQAPIPDRNLPVYSILVPLYREANVAADLVHAISALNYPREKLDVKLILEPDDKETREALQPMLLDPCFQIVLAPVLGPRTKPKALQAALPLARGDFVVVYDAEDRPHPDQLREACKQFRQSGPEIACLQARLAIDNKSPNFFVRQFRAEYAGLFDVLLPALAQWRLPLPLGGTSNHFRADVLRRVGGWDPHNVTEDADLGIRLARFGYRTAILDSTTTEEAPTGFGAWIAQRTRWFKGWFQTYIVHMRDRKMFRTEIDRRSYFTFQLLIGGALLSALVHPLLLLDVASNFTGGAFEFENWFDSIEKPLALFTLLLGYVAFASVAIAGQRRRKFSSTVFVVLTTPLYWLMLSAAAWRAVWQLASAPYHWEKTEHGLAPRENDRNG